MIRWKQPRDIKGIVKLVRTQLVPKSPWQHPRDGRLHSEIVDRLRKGATLVASRSRSEEPFGFLHLIVQDKVLFIDLLAVDPTHQNRRWGTELMSRAEEYGRKKGCIKSILYVDKDNAKAQRFYSKLGYSNAQYVEALVCYRMEKKLDIDPGWIWHFAIGNEENQLQETRGNRSFRESHKSGYGNGPSAAGDDWLYRPL
ncbi:N-acetyltransferase [Cohnella sp. AR92]|uniref:GNAT family N-acetyltransferase n=1 Tax=Cohnella sp. AR92 TaxID=648716 RepID=UPI000F8EC930|nr:GNAT family N-acetyltransferase [Cohnella sp. AR92]RUS45456.1 GNAT family N-acetyltransferase [Cohnella sp. AR92]